MEIDRVQIDKLRMTEIGTQGTQGVHRTEILEVHQIDVPAYKQ